MALIDRETISILLYVFIISRPSRRFNIGTSTWDECVVIPVPRGGRMGIANPCRGWGSRTEPTGESYRDGRVEEGEEGGRGERMTVRT